MSNRRHVLGISCYLYTSALTCVTIESVITILLLAADRFKLTFHNKNGTNDTKRRRYIRHCICSWGWSMLGCVPMFLHTVNDAELGKCYVNWDSDDVTSGIILPKSKCDIDMHVKQIVFLIIMAFVVCVVPLSILGFIYFKIHLHAMLSKRFKNTRCKCDFAINMYFREVGTRCHNGHHRKQRLSIVLGKTN